MSCSACCPGTIIRRGGDGLRVRCFGISSICVTFKWNAHVASRRVIPSLLSFKREAARICYAAQEGTSSSRVDVAWSSKINSLPTLRVTHLSSPLRVYRYTFDHRNLHSDHVPVNWPNCNLQNVRRMVSGSAFTYAKESHANRQTHSVKTC